MVEVSVVFCVLGFLLGMVEVVVFVLKFFF